MGFEYSWAATNISGEAGADGRVDSVYSSRANMDPVSHLSTGIAILEEGDDELPVVGGHVCWGGR